MIEFIKLYLPTIIAFATSIVGIAEAIHSAKELTTFKKTDKLKHENLVKKNIASFEQVAIKLEALTEAQDKYCKTLEEQNKQLLEENQQLKEYNQAIQENVDDIKILKATIDDLRSRL